MLTERQRTMVTDIKAAIAFLKDHEKVEKTTLTAILARAGVDNQGHFYSTVKSLRQKKDDPEAQRLVKEIKEGMAALGVEPSYLKGIRKLKVVDKEKNEEVVQPSLRRSKKDVAPTAVTFPAVNDEQSALNVCISSLSGLPQTKRENIINSVSMFYGLGAH